MNSSPSFFIYVPTSLGGAGGGGRQEIGLWGGGGGGLPGYVVELCLPNNGVSSVREVWNSSCVEMEEHNLLALIELSRINKIT